MAGKVDTTGMVLIKDSRFMMGLEPWLRDEVIRVEANGTRVHALKVDEEKPRREVRVTDFFIDRTKFTNADLQRVVQRYARKFDLYSTPCGGERSSRIASGDNAADLWKEHKDKIDFQTTCGLEVKPSLAIELPQSPEGFDGPNQPLVNVSWEQADWLCRVQGKRLPTEAEWEKAAIGPSKGYNPKIEDRPDSGKCNTRHPERTADVCSEGEKGWGLCDMHGNVWDWVSDWNDVDYYKNPPSMNPTGPKTGDHKVLRGGFWCYFIDGVVRATSRDHAHPGYRNGYIGFRCAVSAEDSKK